MEKEMEEVFQRKVSEKTSRLEGSQLELVTIIIKTTIYAKSQLGTGFTKLLCKIFFNFSP